MLDLRRVGSIEGRDGKLRTGVLTPYDAYVPFRDAGTFVVTEGPYTATYHALAPTGAPEWGIAALPPSDASTMPPEHARLFRLLATRWVFASHQEMTVYWPFEYPSVEYSPWGIFPSRAAYSDWERGKVRGEIWNLEDDDPLPSEMFVAAEWRGPRRAGTRYVAVSAPDHSIAALLRGRAVRCRSCDTLTGRHLLQDKYAASPLTDLRIMGRREVLEAYRASLGISWAEVMRREGVPSPDHATL